MNRAILRMKSSVVSAAAICVSLFLLSIVGHSRLSDARSGSGQPLPEMPASTSIAAIPPSLGAAERPVARDTSSGGVAPDSARDGSDLVADSSMYLFLHQMRYQAIADPITPRSSTCTE